MSTITVIVNGTVYCPDQNINGQLLDVVVEGEHIKELVAGGTAMAKYPGSNCVNAKGLIVTPGLIDAHVHVYEHATPLGVSADELCLARGVTAVVDCGSSGSSTFPGLLNFVARKCKTRVYALLNVSTSGLSWAGMAGKRVGGENDNPTELQADTLIERARAHPDVVVGVKVRIQRNCCGGGKTEEQAYKCGLEASAALGLPLMTHHILSNVPSQQCPGYLRTGDIYTHTYHGWHDGGVAEIDPLKHALRVSDAAIEARKRGVLFDLAHGGGAFSWTVAEEFVKQGFWPDTISTDLHAASAAPGPAYDLPTVMSKLLHCGMDLYSVIKSSTITPAKMYGLDKRGLGSLRPGTVADVSVLHLDTSRSIKMEDSHGQLRAVKQILSAAGVMVAGARFDHLITRAKLGNGEGYPKDLVNPDLLFKDLSGTGGCCGSYQDQITKRFQTCPEPFLGLESVLNATGTLTSLGGSRMHPKAVEAARIASEHFVNLPEFIRRAGNELARLAKCPDTHTGYPSTGAATSLALSACACIQLACPHISPKGNMPWRASRDPKGIKELRIIADGSSDVRWMSVIEMTGATIHLVGDIKNVMTEQQLADALNYQEDGVVIVGLFIFAAELGCRGRLTYSQIQKITKASSRPNVPVIVDAAAMLGGQRGPDALWEFTHHPYPADVVMFSGGKSLRSSQSSGIMLGRKDIIAQAAKNGNPNEGSIIRLSKCTKEDIAALLAALRVFVSETPEQRAAVTKGWWKSVEHGKEFFKSCGIDSFCEMPNPDTDGECQPNTIPRLVLNIPGVKPAGSSLEHSNPFDAVKSNIDPKENPTAALRAALAASHPPIIIDVTPSNHPSLTPWILSEAEWQHVLNVTAHLVNVIILGKKPSAVLSNL